MCDAVKWRPDPFLFVVNVSTNDGVGESQPTSRADTTYSPVIRAGCCGIIWDALVVHLASSWVLSSWN